MSQYKYDTYMAKSFLMEIKASDVLYIIYWSFSLCYIDNGHYYYFNNNNNSNNIIIINVIITRNIFYIIYNIILYKLYIIWWYN